MNTTHIWHELTHASHLQRLKNDRGNLWASNYWSKYAGQIITNELSTGNSYGSKGDQNWQIIALAEGWANYREWKLAESFIDNDFPDYYGKMFRSLNDIGCSDSNMEACLTTTTIAEFKRNLAAKYPYLISRINTIIKTEYE